MVATRNLAAPLLLVLPLLLSTGCQGGTEPSSPSSTLFPDDRFTPVIVRGQWIPANGTTSRSEKGKIQVVVDGDQIDVNRDARLPSSASGDWYEDAFMLERGSDVQVFVTIKGGIAGMATGCELEADGVILAHEGKRMAKGNTVICEARVPSK